ncbi:MAG: endonuclease/exonuclease/phosphatase family protein [Burkholderiales bacterium]|nr:endonuclease/exonuclease/phosphatase family protein [Burkholderiales bacterium]
MRLITWNIQWGLGVDGRVDLARIVETARGLGDFDVLCLQEVTRNYPGLKGNDGGDQFAALARLLPGFHAIDGIAVDRYTDGVGRQQFGNMILTRLAPLAVLRHQLPQPADPQSATMPRLALEAVLAAPGGPLRVTTTHLEYYSALHRAAQIERLRQLQAEAAGHAALPPRPERVGTPFEVRPRNARAILTGDFNCAADDALIARVQAPLDGGAPAYCDAWTLLHPDRPHAPTVGLYDIEQWQGRRLCFDFIFVSADLAPRAQRIVVDDATDASDHQPVLLEIDA